MEYRDKVMASVDASKFILIAREHLGGSIPENDPFVKESGLLTKTAKKGLQVSAPYISKSGMSIAAQGYIGMKTAKSARLVITKVAQLKRTIKTVVNKVKEITGTFIRSGGKAVKVTGKSINKAGKGTEMAGEITNTAGDVVNTAAEASAFIPVADLVTVPTGLAAGTTAKGAGAITRGIGKLEEISGQAVESGGKLVENTGNSLRSAGSTVTKGTTDIASKVCRAMTRSGNIIVRTNGKVLSSMIKATGKTSNAASFSLSKMYEGVSKGVRCNEEKELIR